MVARSWVLGPIRFGKNVGDKYIFLCWVTLPRAVHLKVHKIEIFFGFDFEICIISLIVM
jgi:hypothetical protein